VHKLSTFIAAALLPAGVIAAAAGPVVAIKAQAPAGVKPPWTKGIAPITPQGYYNAIECGKIGGENPPCVFWDTALCRNDDFDVAFHTGYKAVAYEVWQAVRQKHPAPTPDYNQAQRTKVTIGITEARAAGNAIADLVVKRAGRVVAPVDRSSSANGRRATFEYAPFAPTAAVTIEMIGKRRTIACTIDPVVLSRLR